jgi:hypothetical protein
MNQRLYLIKSGVIKLALLSLLAVLSACVSRTETIPIQAAQEHSQMPTPRQDVAQASAHTQVDPSKVTSTFVGRLVRIGPEMERLWGLETKEKTYLLKFESDYSRQVFAWQNQQVQIVGQLINYRLEVGIQVHKMQPIQ